MKKRIRQLLKDHGKDQAYLAALLGITYQSVSIKVNGHKDFTQSELFKIMVDFDLSPSEFVKIFFTMDQNQDYE